MIKDFIRFSSVVSIGYRSSIFFSSRRALLVTMLFLPIIEVLYIVLLGEDLKAPSVARIAYAASLVALTISVANGIVARVVLDRNLGIFLEIHTRRKVDFSYWFGVAVVPIGINLVTTLLIISGMSFLFKTSLFETLFYFFCLLFISLLMGFALGVFCTGLGVSMKDPYMAINILGSLIPIFSGVIVSVHLFPAWLESICVFVPMSATLNSLDFLLSQGTFSVLDLLGDLLIAILLTSLGILLTGVSVFRLRSGLRRDPI